MTTLDPGQDFNASVTPRCARIRRGRAAAPVSQVGSPRRSRSAPTHVFAKRLAKPDPIWAWYFAREVALYRAFAPSRTGVRGAAPDRGHLRRRSSLERLAGEPLAARRRPNRDAADPHDRPRYSPRPTRLAVWPPAHRAWPRRRRACVRTCASACSKFPDEPTWVREGIRLAARRGIAGRRRSRAPSTTRSARYTHTAFALRRACCSATRSPTTTMRSRSSTGSAPGTPSARLGPRVVVDAARRAGARPRRRRRARQRRPLACVPRARRVRVRARAAVSLRVWTAREDGRRARRDRGRDGGGRRATRLIGRENDRSRRRRTRARVT